MAPALAKCPGCGAHADSGVRCEYCGTPLVFAAVEPQPPRPAQRSALEVERDELHAKLIAAEREWNGRILRAQRPMAADVVVPPAMGCAAAALFAIVCLGVLIGFGYPSDTPLQLLIDLAGWVLILIVVVQVMRARRARRVAESMSIVAQRDAALAPLREELAAVEAKIAAAAPRPTERELRIAALDKERTAVKGEVDACFWRVEQARNDSYADLIIVPTVGCGGGYVLATIVAAVAMGLGVEQESFSSSMISGCFSWAAVLGGFFAALLWRVPPRQRKIAALTKARDEAVPGLQQRLHELDEELARLAPERGD